MGKIFSARPAWVEVNLDSIVHNVRELAALSGPETKLVAVVKADGYGHGAAEVAAAALEAGAARLAVAFVEEGVALRRAGIDAPVIVFGYTGPENFSCLVEQRLVPTVFSFDSAAQLSQAALEMGVNLALHLKVDTGMGRLGLNPGEAVGEISRIAGLPRLRLEGIMTHLAAADEGDRTYTEGQLLLFNRIIEGCREKGVVIPLVHAANSAGLIAYPASRYNMVRPGISIYGHCPGPALAPVIPELRPAMTFKSRIVHVKRVPPGTAISYGCTYRTASEALIATVSAGYADGYNRLFSNRGQVLVRGRRAAVVGRVCMDHFMVDVSAVPGARPGDEVVLYGRQGPGEVSVDEAASLIGTISYELLCAVGRRVPRFYFRRGRLVAIRDYPGARAPAPEDRGPA